MAAASPPARSLTDPFVGQGVAKQFIIKGKATWFTGTVLKKVVRSPEKDSRREVDCWFVKYEDGDDEDMLVRV